MNASDPPAWVFFLGPVWIVGWITASIIYRRAAGKPLFPRLPPSHRFAQRMASGWSEDNWLRSLGGANNCLMVAVTDRELVVTPFFPFNLMFLPEIWGLEMRAPLSRIRKIEPVSRLFVSALRVELDDGRRIALVVRDAERFRLALGKP